MREFQKKEHTTRTRLGKIERATYSNRIKEFQKKEQTVRKSLEIFERD